MATGCWRICGWRGANVFRDGGQDGWLTSAVSRPAMIENLAAVLATEPRCSRVRDC